MKTKIKSWVGLVLVVLLAVFLRFWALGQFPPGLYPDEAVNATDGLEALQVSDLKVYYPNNNGREGLFINLLALSFKLFGVNILALRAVPAIIGSLTVLALYFLGKEMFGARTGLTAAFLVAVSYWHLNFSRIGFRAILMPLILTATFYFLFRGYHKLKERTARKTKKLEAWKSWLLFLIAGLIFGVGFHTYIAFRVAPAIVLAFFLFLGAAHRKTKINLKLTAVAFSVFVLGVLMTTAPILSFFVTNPQSLGARQNDNSISVFDPKNNQGNLLLTVGKTFGLTLGQFISWGDANWRHNLPKNPQLSPLPAFMFWGGLLVAGIVFLVSILKNWRLKIFNSLKEKRLFRAIKDPKESLIKYGTLLVWFFIMLSPAFLTVEGIPHALRSIGSLPAAYLMAAIPIAFVLKGGFSQEKLLQNKRGRRQLILGRVLVIAGLVLTLIYNAGNYFLVWGRSAAAAQAFERRLINIGQYLKNSRDTRKKYLIVNLDSKKIDTGYPVSLETIRFVNWEKKEEVTYLLPADLEKIKDEKEAGKELEIILQKKDDELVEELEADGLKVEEINLSPDYEGTGFLIFR